MVLNQKKVRINGQEVVKIVVKIKRRPRVIQGSNMTELLKAGYKINKKTGYYEKSVELKTKGKTHKVTLRAAKISDADDAGKFNFYTCDPSENNEHMYIGFLSRGNNPSDLCMPCCFKKDHLYSDNKKKKIIILNVLEINLQIIKLKK